MKNFILFLSISFSLCFVPFHVLAHSTEAGAGEETMNYWNYGLGVSLFLTVIFLALFLVIKSKIKKLNLKNKEDRQKNNVLSKRGALYKWGSVVTSVLAVLSLIMLNTGGEKEEMVEFQHIHGLGYTSDGEKLFVPAHDGLRVYHDGTWMISEAGEKHDYMGFSMFEGGFYSSGHPATGSDLANPLGIVKSTDEGKTIEMVDLYKETDFHGMTVGYGTEDIYVFNAEENSRMTQPGFYYSTDQTETWNQSELQGLTGQAAALAAHPTEEGTVAIGTDQGIFLSGNYGDSFENVAVTEPVSAVSFGHQNNLLAATQSDSIKLVQVDLSTNEVTELNIPDLGDDPIAYIQQNPANESELVFATHGKDIYFSHDSGETWEQSVEEGVAMHDH